MPIPVFRFMLIVVLLQLGFIHTFNLHAVPARGRVNHLKIS